MVSDDGSGHHHRPSHDPHATRRRAVSQKPSHVSWDQQDYERALAAAQQGRQERFAAAAGSAAPWAHGGTLAPEERFPPHERHGGGAGTRQVADKPTIGEAGWDAVLLEGGLAAASAARAAKIAATMQGAAPFGVGSEPQADAFPQEYHRQQRHRGVQGKVNTGAGFESSVFANSIAATEAARQDRLIKAKQAAAPFALHPDAAAGDREPTPPGARLVRGGSGPPPAEALPGRLSRGGSGVAQMVQGKVTEAGFDATTIQHERQAAKAIQAAIRARSQGTMRALLAHPGQEADDDY